MHIFDSSTDDLFSSKSIPYFRLLFLVDFSLSFFFRKFDLTTLRNIYLYISFHKRNPWPWPWDI